MKKKIIKQSTISTVFLQRNMYTNLRRFKKDTYIDLKKYFKLHVHIVFILLYDIRVEFVERIVWC